MLCKKCIGLFLTICLFGSMAKAGDWTQWRGPQRDNCSSETGLLQSWPASGPKLIWKATGLGKGYATVSVVGTRLYTTGERDGVSYAYALEIGKQQPLWSVPIGKAGAPGWGKFFGPRSTPTVDGDRVYVLGQYGELVCLQASDGLKLWETHLVKELGGKRPEWGYSESVLIDGDQLICTPGGKQGFLAALNKQTGKVLWRSSDCTDNAHYASVIIATLGGVKQYVQLTPASVVGVGTDGALLWQTKRKGKTAVIPTPVVKDNLVYVTSGYGIGCACFEITKNVDGFSVRPAYQEKVMVNQVGGVVLQGDYVYGHCDKKGWTCQAIATGEVKWTNKAVGKGALTYADGCFYLRSEKKGTLALIKATPAGFQETGRFTQPGFGKEQTWPPVVIVNKMLFVRDQDQLLGYDIAQP
ncbi:PQQ-binding-like beta-propeller repeat protein [Planctomycetota bacterium]